MGPVVRVVGDPATCEPLGGGRFRLRPRHGRYELPELVLSGHGAGDAPTLLELRLARPLSPSTASEQVYERWAAHQLPPRSRPRLDRPVRTGRAWLDAAALPALGTVTVTWAGTFLDGQDQDELEVVVTLEFEPDRNHGHPGYAAVDFGTTNSTVTLHDTSRIQPRALAVSQARMARDQLVALLRHDDDEWAQVVADVAETVLGVDEGQPAAALHRQLLAALADEDLTAPRLLYDTLLAVEKQRGWCSPQLRAWLADRLHACYDAAFAVPGLETWQLYAVELDAASREPEIASRTRVTKVSPLEVELGEAAEDDGHGGGSVHHGLKQYLGSSKREKVSDGSSDGEAETDDLIRAAYSHLFAQTNAFTQRNRDRLELSTRPIGHAIVTYPTIASPAVRHKLHKLVTDRAGAGIAQVETHYDEAIAAAMFFLMRDFGRDLDLGAEAFKTRGRRVGHDQDAWRQNVLVIDIGGGTADIALLSLTLTDATPALEGLTERDAKWAGRYWRITPRVRGSTGAFQMGGEYLTLRVFSWLKAMIADRLLVDAAPELSSVIQSLEPRYRPGGGYEPGTLVKKVVDQPDKPDGDVLDVLEQVVPTRWKSDQRREQAFRLLWRLAERAKRHLGDLGAEPTAVISEGDVQQVLAAVSAASGGSRFKDISGFELRLDRKTFADLVTPTLSTLMSIATRLADDRLQKGEPLDEGEPLDRIILTGRSSALGQVREVFNAQFGRLREDGELKINWKATDVTVELDYPKLACSIGACWAERMKQHIFNPRLEGTQHMLRDGLTLVEVDVRNLFFNLPCTFSQGQAQPDATPLDIPVELRQLDGQEIGKARSEWRPLSLAYNVYRDTTGPLWGRFQLNRYANDHEPSFELRRSVWPSEIEAQVEVTQDLDLFLHLCRGPRHYEVAGEGLDLVEALDDKQRAALTGPDGAITLPGPPGDVVANAGMGEPAGRVVFQKESAFGEVFVYAGDRDERRVKGAISGPLPDPPERHDGAAAGWEFHLRRSDNSLKRIGWLERPPHGDFPTFYRATLDERGQLRVHVGEVPYRPARTLREVEERPGAVLKVQMVPPDETHDKTRDPFNGTH